MFLSNDSNSVLYIGVTNDVERRMSEHADRAGKLFPHKYKLNRLLYIEEYENVNNAIAREKNLKNWKRAWKDELVTRANPSWKDPAHL